MIVLVLEDENNVYNHKFNSTEGFEEFLKTINLNDYTYKNILFITNEELNWSLTKIYKQRYLKV